MATVRGFARAARCQRFISHLERARVVSRRQGMSDAAMLSSLSLHLAAGLIVDVEQEITGTEDGDDFNDLVADYLWMRRVSAEMPRMIDMLKAIRKERADRAGSSLTRT